MHVNNLLEPVPCGLPPVCSLPLSLCRSPLHSDLQEGGAAFQIGWAPAAAVWPAAHSGDRSRRKQGEDEKTSVRKCKRVILAGGRGWGERRHSSKDVRFTLKTLIWVCVFICVSRPNHGEGQLLSNVNKCIPLLSASHLYVSLSKFMLPYVYISRSPAKLRACNKTVKL